MAKYRSTWQQYLPEIYLAIDKSLFYHAEMAIELNSQSFEGVGKRYISKYHFRLEIEYGKLANNISGTIVARDLLDILKTDEHQRAWLSNKKILIRADLNWTLKIKCTL